jgi:hypothetical protein
VTIGGTTGEAKSKDVDVGGVSGGVEVVIGKGD